ncbi:MAG: hypothetical protein AB7H97_09090 [Pseudobdellovibrionaceae bacterium]
MKVLLSIFTFLSLSNACAAGGISGGGFGPDGLYRECVGMLEGRTEVEFLVRQTAVPTFIEGVMDDRASGDRIAHFKCVFGDTRVDGGIEWNCTEIANHDGKMTVLVRSDRSGVTAGVARQQMFPLEPQSIGHLKCSSTP